MAAIVKSILMWPSAVAYDISQGAYATVVVGVAVPMYFLGMPSTDMEISQLATWYASTGASLMVARMAFGPAVPPTSGGPSSGGGSSGGSSIY